MLQMVAEEFGLPMDKVKIAQKYVDTLTQPWDWGSFASRSCYLNGWAVKLACAEAKKVLLKYAAEKLKSDPAHLEFREGKVYDKLNPKVSATLAEVAHYATETSKQPGQVMGAYNFVPTENPLPFGAQFVEVEIDTETGKLAIPKFIAVHDVGKAINPTIVEGQTEGGIVQGLGLALMEELKVDPATGRSTATNFLDYNVPRSTDIPNKFEVVLVETNDPVGPYGAKGVGEPPMVPTPGAIANAVYNAIGVRITDLPITPEKILRALGKV